MGEGEREMKKSGEEEEKGSKEENANVKGRRIAAIHGVLCKQ